MNSRRRICILLALAAYSAFAVGGYAWHDLACSHAHFAAHAAGHEHEYGPAWDVSTTDGDDHGQSCPVCQWLVQGKGLAPPAAQSFEASGHRPLLATANARLTQAHCPAYSARGPPS